MNASISQMDIFCNGCQSDVPQEDFCTNCNNCTYHGCCNCTGTIIGSVAATPASGQNGSMTKAPVPAAAPMVAPAGGVARAPVQHAKRILAKNLKPKNFFKTDWGFAYLEATKIGQDKTILDYWGYKDGKWNHKQLEYNNDAGFRWEYQVDLPKEIGLPPSADFLPKAPVPPPTTGGGNGPTASVPAKQPIKANAHSPTCKKCGKANKRIDVGFKPLYYCPICEP